MFSQNLNEDTEFTIYWRGRNKNRQIDFRSISLLSETGLGQSQVPGTWSKSPSGAAVTQSLHPSLLFPRDALAGSRSQHLELGIKDVYYDMGHSHMHH